MDAPTFPGCVTPCRPIGVIEARQAEGGGKMKRNDRLIALASESRRHQGVDSLSGLNDILLDEIEHFFTQYSQMRGRKFKLLGRRGPQAAKSIVEEGRKRRNGA